MLKREKNANAPRPRRAKIVGAGKTAMTLTKIAVSVENLAYILVADRAQPYGRKKSKIVYIGTTRKGVDRIAGSIAAKARTALKLHGVKTVEAHVYSCRGRSRVQMWRLLERGLLVAFRERYGRLPEYNRQGESWDWDDVESYFSAAGLKNVIRRYEPAGSRRRS
jgi:hypothetical protein